MRVAYYCDGLDECSDKPGCYRFMYPGMDYCRHTANPDHAVYGPCEHPEEHPERFHVIDINDTETCYWEGEVFSPSDYVFLHAYTNERELVKE